MEIQHDVEALQAREKILEAAVALFAQQGYDTTSLSQVARQANVSKALIFWHFENKEQLYRSALQKTLEPYFIDLDEPQGQSPQDQIAKLIDSFYDFVTDNVYSVRFFLSLVLRHDQSDEEGFRRVSELYSLFRGSLQQIIEMGQRDGVFRRDADAARDAGLTMVTLAGILVQQFMDGESPAQATDLVEHLKITLFQRLIHTTTGSPAAGRLE